jgi:hypothetical protein
VSHSEHSRAQPICKFGERLEHGPYGRVLMRINAASAGAEVGINRINSDELDITYFGDMALEHIKIL